MNLDATTKSLEVVLAGAVTTNQLPFTAHYVDVTTATFAATAAGEADGTTNNTTAVTMVAAPASGTTRLIKSISIFNKDTVAATVTVQINNNGTARIVWKGALAVGDNLLYDAD